MLTRWMALLGLCLVGWPVLASADEWSQFRGSNGTGVADGAKLATEWGPDKNVQWKVKVPGAAWSSPIVWGDRVFVTTAITENQKKPSGGFGGPGGPGGPGGRPGGRPGGPGGFGPPPRPGQVLPGPVQERLNLSADQKKQMEQMQKEVDAQLEKLFTDEQKKNLKELPQGPGRGGPGGPGGFGGPSQPGQIISPALQERLKLTAAQKQQMGELQKEVDGKLGKVLTADQVKQLKEQLPGFGPGGPGRGGPGGFGGGRPPDAVYRWEVYCLDRTSGKVLWKQLALEGKPRTPSHSSNTFATETPATDGERVYAYFGMNGLVCLDFAGKQVWKKDLGSYPVQMGWGTASSPVLDDERLFVQIDNEEKSFLVALDKKTGNEVWRVARSERTNWGSPVLWKNKQRTELVAPGSQKVCSYEPSTGKILWELSLGGGQCNSTPVGDAEMLYVGLGGRGGMGGDRGGAGGPGGGGSLFAIRAGASGDLTLKEGAQSNAGVAWSVSGRGPEMASPLVYQGHLYVLARDGGLVTCYDAESGKQVYRERISGARSFWASPVASDGKVFCLDDSGTTHVLQAGPEFKVLGKNSLGEMSWSSPAVVGGAILLRGIDHLFCVKP